MKKLVLAGAILALASCSTTTIIRPPPVTHTVPISPTDSAKPEPPAQSPAQAKAHQPTQATPPAPTPSVSTLCSGESGTSGCAPSNKVTYYDGGWYVITGPCDYGTAAGGCTGPYIGTIRPPGYSGSEPKAPMNNGANSTPTATPTSSGEAQPGTGNGAPVLLNQVTFRVDCLVILIVADSVYPTTDICAASVA